MNIDARTFIWWMTAPEMARTSYASETLFIAAVTCRYIYNDF